MGWIYLAVSEGLQKLSRDTSDLSPIARSTPTLVVCSCQEWLVETSLTFQYGTTRHRSEGPCYQESTSSTEASPARTFRSRDAEQAWRESEAVFSSRSCAWPRKSSPSSYSLRTFPTFDPKGSVLLLPKWIGWGMTVDGVFYPLQMWERITKGKDGSCWLIMAARDTAISPVLRKEVRITIGHMSLKGLTIQRIPVAQIPPLAKMWPTPL